MTEDIFALNEELSPQQIPLLRGMVVDVAKLSEEIKACQEQESLLKAKKEAIEQEAIKLLKTCLPADENGKPTLKSLQFSDGVGVTYRVTPYPRLKSKDFKPQLYAWLKRNRYWGLATMNERTLVGLLRNRIETGQSLPDYIDASFKKENLVITDKEHVLRKKEEPDASPTV